MNDDSQAKIPVLDPSCAGASADVERESQEIVRLSRELEQAKQICDQHGERLRFLATIINALSAEPPALQEYKRLLKTEYRKFASENDSLADEAGALLKLQEVRQELELLSYDVAIAQKTVIAIAGSFSSGKSSFMNSFFPTRKIKLPTGMTQTTAIPSYVLPAETPGITGCSFKGGHVAIPEKMFALFGHDKMQAFNFNMRQLVHDIVFRNQFVHEFKNLCFIDTPGFNPGAERESDTNAATKAIAGSAAIIWCVDVCAGTPKNDEIDILSGIRQNLPDIAIYVVVNKADLRSVEEVASVMDEIESQLGIADIAFAGIAPYSANYRFDQQPEEFAGMARRISLGDFLANFDVPNDQKETHLLGEVKEVFDGYVQASQDRIARLEGQVKTLDTLQTAITLKLDKKDGAILKYVSQRDKKYGHDATAEIEEDKGELFAGLEKVRSDSRKIIAKDKREIAQANDLCEKMQHCVAALFGHKLGETVRLPRASIGPVSQGAKNLSQSADAFLAEIRALGTTKEAPAGATYLVLDLSAGAEAGHYRYRYEAALPPDPQSIPPHELWLRRIPAGKFMMGDSVGSGHADEKPIHEVELTQDFYVGVFPVLQRQWELVMGDNPSEFKNVGPNAPVDSVSYDDICGPDRAWPQNGDDAVTLESFLGRLRARTGLRFDLPTEAQWEYACRAGTMTDLYDGENLTSHDGSCPHLDAVAWYDQNCFPMTHWVAYKKPNAWGLYDMLGNVWEWCRNRREAYPDNAVTDPVGADSGWTRALRGGGWGSNARYCRAASRSDYVSNSCFHNLGFRLFVLAGDAMEIHDNATKSLGQTNESSHGSSPTSTVVNVALGAGVMVGAIGGVVGGLMKHLFDSPHSPSMSFVAPYLVLDLSTGIKEEHLPHRYEQKLPQTVPAHELWLRRIPAGKFMMGDSVGKGHNDEKPVHEVELTRDFYIGVFPVLQRQWELVMGDNPSEFKNIGPIAPVDSVSYDDICGQDRPWPREGDDAVGEDSFLGRLRALTGRRFDLPTEAQWEYACRAGTTTDLNDGKNLTTIDGNCPNLAAVAWHGENSDKTTHPVGGKTPNAWGLYDMLGNVWEWCRDWKGDYSADAVKDPAGGNSGRSRVLRGGGKDSGSRFCRSASRIDYSPSLENKLDTHGLRLFLPVDDLYLVLDLSVGANGERYPCRCEDALPLLHSIPSHELWLRRIPAGKFMMGDSVGIGCSDEQPVHEVELTQDFYVGVFPVLQRQWELVMGENRSLSPLVGDRVPVDNVSYDDICGENRHWPNNCDDSVAPGSFLGRLRSRTGLPFDLPTEAQWEYACRAGTMTDLNNGENLTSKCEYCHNLDAVAWYSANSGDACHAIGDKKPNAWGLYDMHGGGWEWCRDWYGKKYYHESPAQDPMGAVSGSARVRRGGDGHCAPVLCRSAFRGYCSPGFRGGSGSSSASGFRLFLPAGQK